MEKILCKVLTTKDEVHFAAGLELLNRTQGRDLFPSNYLAERTADPQSYVLGAFLGKELVAVAIAQLIHDFEYYLPFDPGLGEELKNKKVGSFSTLCVLESLQGKGVGQKLSQMRLEWVKENKCEVVLGVSWVSGLSHTSDRVFKKMGFNAVKRVDHFYVASSLKDPFDCPGCKSAPCVCAAVLYRLDLRV